MKTNPLLEQSRSFAVNIGMICRSFSSAHETSDAAVRLATISSDLYMYIVKAQADGFLPNKLRLFVAASDAALECEALLIELHYAGLYEKFYQTYSVVCNKIKTMLVTARNKIEQKQINCSKIR